MPPIGYSTVQTRLELCAQRLPACLAGRVQRGNRARCHQVDPRGNAPGQRHLARLLDDARRQPHAKQRLAPLRRDRHNGRGWIHAQRDLIIHPHPSLQPHQQDPQDQSRHHKESRGRFPHLLPPMDR